ncbi:LysR family transcriptional regulator [Bacillus solimangrovi]|uniref:HTH lysR-type domain-containing protein n=1 Tax=Bacillus solimangrovi TaxID=1305675 RepID=A0A1E5LI70_9BACI|nr:LysR family transcriptional regulator [Bacillus solimangrovi]OEH93758.1 hypothetical protein BFG57_11270 [Bacillus solimangrovi]
MTLLQYEVFKTVVDLKSFTQAGEKLGLTQGAVSHAIKSLESEFDLTLLYRSRSGITLTKEGERMIPYIRQILSISEQMKQEAGKMNGLEIGTIRIGTFSSVSASLLPTILKQFHQQYPSIEIELYEGGYGDIRHMLQSGKIDIGFLPSSEIESLDFIKLLEDPLYVLLPKNHQLNKRKKISILELTTDPFIMPKGGCDALVKKVFKENKIKTNVFCEIEDNPTIVAMVEKELGISIMPDMVINTCSGDVAISRLSEDYYRSIGLASKSFAHVSPVVRAFIDQTEQYVNSAYHAK